MSGRHGLEHVAAPDSALRRASAGAKLAAALLFVVAVLSIPRSHAGWAALALVPCAAVARAARVPWSAFLGRLALAQPFVLGVAVLALFQRGGLAAFARITLESTACVAALQLLALTTPLVDLLAVLRRLRVPAPFVLTLALLHRYRFVLVDESRRMHRARVARTWQTPAFETWRSLASVIALSFVRSVSRAERIAVAMRARGWS